MQGYRNKYHLDEELKHDKFWNDHRSLDKFHKYGKHGSHFHKVLRKKKKKSDKKVHLDFLGETRHLLHFPKFRKRRKLSTHSLEIKNNKLVI